MAELENNKTSKVKELALDAIITHGPDALVNGHIIAADNSAFSFYDVYRFKSADGTTIKSIQTFTIKQNITEEVTFSYDISFTLYTT
ncbi:hypothetical protein [Mucilaginibacter arboris]|uniref:Uncharacterized protein n=1 Tax=Mucilaginibacter arboris TaxID=2682090 RepID=A0A7K1SU16_9SPHI|nr:hypothetical protein [Mucilaginibacter arboris]MVN20753.1 hypothetical protein [Mucilaginibacter arboris]